MGPPDLCGILVDVGESEYTWHRGAFGPRSRDLRQYLSTSDLSDEAVPFRRVAPIDIGLAEPLCMRISYAGELGYELYVPVEQVLGLYDHLLAGGQAFALRHGGLKTLNSLRLEMAYRDDGHDLDNTDTPLQAGLGFSVDLKSPGDFWDARPCPEESKIGLLADPWCRCRCRCSSPKRSCIAGRRFSARVSLRSLLPPLDMRGGVAGSAPGAE